MKTVLSIIFVLFLEYVVGLKYPVCGLKPRINSCIMNVFPVPKFYYYDENRNECYILQDPCKKLVRKFATKAICQTICVE
ncbi:uncharacterized protein LOC108134739 [Drosophila elegans]|uniref:uncharacterized protein LOC108134739 n=1 Tax=Drosophila elegans TaxID=30023 RepID=UPI0007E7BA91|nr:uncharacterized protein LOC108134739 [Drosophila elegans]